jgi:hypothetical protein
MGAINVHLAAAQGFPETIDADMPHASIGDLIDELRC